MTTSNVFSSYQAVRKVSNLPASLFSAAPVGSHKVFVPLLISCFLDHQQASAPSPSSSQSNNATPPPFTSSTKSTPTSTPNTAPPSPTCSNPSPTRPRKAGWAAVSSSARRFDRRCCEWRRSVTESGIIRIRAVVLWWLVGTRRCSLWRGRSSRWG